LGSAGFPFSNYLILGFKIPLFSDFKTIITISQTQEKIGARLERVKEMYKTPQNAFRRCSGAFGARVKG
jgi:hypothetical protein